MLTVSMEKLNQLILAEVNKVADIIEETEEMDGSETVLLLLQGNMMGLLTALKFMQNNKSENKT